MYGEVAMERDAQEMQGDAADLVLGALQSVVGGLAAAFGPACEVVLHDFRRPEASIVAIAGTVTSRHVGGAMSEIGLELLSQGDAAQDKLNYVTRTPDGRTIKSSTMILRDSMGVAFGALGVNMDITGFRLAISSLTALAGRSEVPAAPVTVFSDDISEVIRTVIAQEEERLGRALHHDTRSARLEIVKALNSRGVFHLSQAANEVARYLGVSRATIYADLNTVKGPPAHS